MASTALTASAASVPSAISVSMFVAPWRNNRAAVRRNGHPPAISTATARISTVHPSRALAGPTTAIRNATSASGHEITARSPQWSDRSPIVPLSFSSTASAEYPAPSTAPTSSSTPTAAGS